MTFSMIWGKDGKPRLSKNAPAVLRKLVEEGHFSQKPVPECSKPRKRPEQFFRCKKSLVPPAGSNPYRVATEEVWLDRDTRNNQSGKSRRVKVLAVGDTHAVVENLDTGTRSAIKLTSFSGKRSKLTRKKQEHV